MVSGAGNVWREAVAPGASLGHTWRNRTEDFQLGKKRSYPDGPCRHCGVKKINRPRALCWNCFHKAGVKDLYPPLPGSYAANSIPKAGQGRLPKEPTHHPPGSEGKMAVMAERASRGETLFHPDDARGGEDGGFLITRGGA